MRPAPLLALLLSVAFTLGLTCPARAQSTEQDILARLLDQPLFLRGFPMEDKLKFNGAGEPEKVYLPGPFTTCGFHAEAVHLLGNHMRIEGVREGLEFDEHGTPHRTVLTTGGLLSKKEEVTIDVDTTGPADLGKVLNAIFVNGFPELAPLVPEFWQQYVRGQNTGEGLSTNPASDSDTRPSHVGGSVEPPRLVRAPSPRYTELAKHARLSGSVEIYLICELDGSPSHIQIIRPLGLGLDEAAMAAVIGYHFNPATQNGKPVRVDLYVKVNFRIR